jgi:hypothetical protein
MSGTTRLKARQSTSKQAAEHPPDSTHAALTVLMPLLDSSGLVARLPGLSVCIGDVARRACPTRAGGDAGPARALTSPDGGHGDPLLAIASDAYTIECMAGLYAVEVEPEVRSWLERLSDRDFGRADFLVGLLAGQAETLGEPYTRHLGGKVRELRFHLLAQQPRITYWLAPGRRIVLLTVFRKTRNAEVAEVARALQAQETCETEHGPAHDTFVREAS